MSCKCSTDQDIQTGNPMQVLKDEHRVIEKVIEAMARQLPREPIDCEFFRQTIEFLRNFADGCHHAKEEVELFPVLESAGIPREGGPIGCMLQEHAQGRLLVGMIADNLDAAVHGDAAAAQDLRRAAAAYIDLLRQHIAKEDNVLFVLADEALGPQEQRLMRDAFDRADRSQGCSTRHPHYVELAEELSQHSLAGGA